MINLNYKKVIKSNNLNDIFNIKSVPNVFIMIMGLPGAGKRILSEKLKDKNILYIKNKEELKDLKNNNIVIYENLNIYKEERISVLKSIPKDFCKIGVMCWARVDTCCARDENKIDGVGNKIVKKYASKFQEPEEKEGFDLLYLLNTDIVDYTRYN